MADKVVLTLSFGQDTAVLTLLDPVFINNTWSCDPPGFLSKGAGKWAQGLGSQAISLLDESNKLMVLDNLLLNMFDPKVGQSGKDAVAFGDGGTVGDSQSVGWVVDSVE
jgi:hypothetical protein